MKVSIPCHNSVHRLEMETAGGERWDTPLVKVTFPQDEALLLTPKGVRTVIASLEACMAYLETHS